MKTITGILFLAIFILITSHSLAQQRNTQTVLPFLKTKTEYSFQSFSLANNTTTPVLKPYDSKVPYTTFFCKLELKNRERFNV